MKIIKKCRVQIIFVVAVLLLWEGVYRLGVFPELMFPSMGGIMESLVKGFTDDDLAGMVLYSMSLIVKGLTIGILLAFVLSSLSIVSKIINKIYSLLVSVFDLLPGVALMPLAILWFGVGEGPIIFLVIHSIIWPMSRSIIDGFQSVPKIYIESGMNLGLSKFELVKDIYLPASFSSVLSGMKIGWARAWRGLISAEMIFGATSSGAGIGFFIYEQRNKLEIAGVFAALVVIIIIGMIVEYGIFNVIERNTVKKWGIRR